jgi:2-polyprenyl-3-methyl-5-hydroxy-6-metoxy-1,4-benzoquinol methylase
VESAELIAILREVRDRVRARNPQTSAGASDVALPDLLPIVHARDAAMGKVAAIGTVNPRTGGPVNGVVQAWKRMLARVLDWHVREQVEFNRKIVACVDAAIEALNDSNRALTELGNRLTERDKLRDEINELKDIRSHWADWRFEWERKLERNEIQFLRSVADLQGAFQHRATLMDATYRDTVRGQHAEFTAALERQNQEIQQRLWADLERIRLEYERLIHEELRIVRQRAQAAASVAAPPSAAPAPSAGEHALPFDYARFAERFRGSEDYVKRGQQVYLPHFRHRRRVLDIGCGRGEFLETMRDAGVSAAGIDLSGESVTMCRHKGLEAERADLFEYLAAQPEGAFDGIFCAQVVEHLPPERLPEMVKLCATRLERHGVLAIETPNPECLAIFATHFYMDPTHTRPVPHALLVFYMEEFGLGNIEVKRLSPAVESMASLAALPEAVRDAFFGALDYAAIATKL